MVVPAQFPASKRGYNAYLKALGVKPGSAEALLYAINLPQFMSVDRKTLDAKIEEAGEWCEKMHEAYKAATCETQKEFYAMRGDYFSKKFVELTRQKRYA